MTKIMNTRFYGKTGPYGKLILMERGVRAKSKKGKIKR